MAKDINRTSKIQKMPSFNKQVLLEEDAANEGLDIPFRFGKGFDTDITLSDGNWTNVKNGRSRGGPMVMMRYDNTLVYISKDHVIIYY